jgi:hypothetical protein
MGNAKRSLHKESYSVSKLCPSLLILILSVGFYSNAFAQGRCLVADPTGTPLKVRTEPNGRIVDTLRNGVLVEIIGSGSSYGKAWAYVGRADSKRLFFGKSAVTRVTAFYLFRQYRFMRGKGHLELTVAALLIGYAVAIAIVFFASRPIAINRPRTWPWSEKWQRPINWRG